jgi:type IV secretion system protein VirB9
MKRIVIFAALSLCLPGAGAPAAAEEPLLPSDGRIKIMLYDESDVYTIVTKYGYQTNIVFGANEEIQTISVGDRSLWQIIPAANRLFIRPMQEDVITNMTILTDRHSYQFDLKSLPMDKDGNIYVAKFTYPNDKPRNSAAAAPVVVMPASPTNAATYSVPRGPVAGPGISEPVNPNYNYTFSGPDELAPLQVYDDGTSTYIKYSNPHQPLPNAYMVDASGKEQLTTIYQRDRVMVIDAVAGQWALKNSNGTILLFNEQLNPKQPSPAEMK